MCELGNGVINQIYEARREEMGSRKPQPADPRYSFFFFKIYFWAFCAFNR